MAQINLLGQEGVGGNVGTKIPLYLVRILATVFVIVLGYWGVLSVRERLTTSQIAKLQAEIIATQKELVEDQSRQELVKRQGQVATVNTLIAEHKYWSKVLPELARVTLRSARYLAFSLSGNGTAKMTVNVSNYTEMDKFLQAFNLPEFNTVFKAVKVVSIGKVQQGDLQLVRFEIEVQYDQNFLKKDQTPSLNALR